MTEKSGKKTIKKAVFSFLLGCGIFICLLVWYGIFYFCLVWITFSPNESQIRKMIFYIPNLLFEYRMISLPVLFAASWLLGFDLLKRFTKLSEEEKSGSVSSDT